MKRERLLIFVAFLITIVLVSFFLLKINLVDLVYLFKQINPFYLIIGFVLYLCSYLFRTYRFHILLNKEVNVKDLFYIVCVYNLANNVLPASTGELSYIYMLKKLHNRNLSEGIASLTVVRVFDLVTIFSLFFISFSHVHIKSTSIMNNLWLVIFFMAIVILLFLTFVFFGDIFISNLRTVFRILGLENKKLFNYLLLKLKEIAKDFEKVKHFEKIIFFKLMGLSCGVWLSLYSFNYILLKALNIDLDFLTVIFSTSFAVFTNVLPIQGIGGFGTLEGGWSVGLIAVGLKNEVAICSAFLFHLIVILYFLILGFFGFLGVKDKSNFKKSILKLFTI